MQMGTVTWERASYQADLIEWAFRHLGIHFDIREIDIGAQWKVFHGLKDPEVRLSQVRRLSQDIALALGVNNCEIVVRNGFVDIRVPRDDPDVVRLLDRLSILPERWPAYTVLLGVDECGDPVGMTLVSPEIAHVLIAGATGSGKTKLAQSMILSLAFTNSTPDLGLVLVDPKGRGYVPFAGLPHLTRWGVVTESRQAVQVLRWGVELMEERDRERVNRPAIIFFIDEVADLVLGEAGNVVIDALSRLTQAGRQTGIHVVASTQKPTVEVVGSLAKSNFPVRIVGSVASPEDAKVASGRKQTGAENLLGRGDFKVIERSGWVTEFQACYVEDREIRQVVISLRGGRPVEDTSPDPLVEEIDLAIPQPGRPVSVCRPDEIEGVVCYYRENGIWPSKAWIRRTFSRGNDKATEILREAQREVDGWGVQSS